MIGLELPRPHHLAYIRRNNVTHTLSSMRPRCTALAILTCDRPARRGSLEVSQTFHFIHHHCPAQAFDRTSPLFPPPPLQIRPGPKCLQPSSVSGMDGRVQSISKHAPRKELFFLLGRLCHRAPDENGAIVSTGEHVKRSKTLRIILERSTPPPYITH